VTTLRLGFAGTPDFAAQHLAALISSEHELVAVLTQPDRRAGRGKQARPSAVKTLALEHGLHIMQPATLRDAATQTAIADLQLDALIVVAYGLILPQSVLDLPRYGCLNVHGSLLPRWRGAAPIQRAVEAGDEESGVTIMQMDAGLDTGPMLADRRTALDPRGTSGDLYAQLAEIAPPLLLDVLEDLPTRRDAAQLQDDSQASYAAKITKEEALINWFEPAPVLARRVRAFNPAPGCYAFIDQQRVKIWAAHVDPSVFGPPGSILSADANGITVCCGEGALILQNLQLPGAKAMPVADVLRGNSALFAPGKSFETVSEP
jgi:methionyl-tRNA formyltransferase